MIAIFIPPYVFLLFSHFNIVQKILVKHTEFLFHFFRQRFDTLQRSGRADVERFL